MMKCFKRILSAALAVIICAGLLAVPAAAKASDDFFGGDVSPVILIHGNTQSDVYLYEDDNVTLKPDADGNPLKGWPPTIDIASVVTQVAAPLLFSILLQRDFGLTKALKSTIRGAFPLLMMDENGIPVHNMRVVSYADADGKPLSLAECSTEMRDAANAHFHLEERDPRIGDDKVYYFAYDSFGNNAFNTKALAEYIKAVSKKHGGSKVSLLPISLGGTLMNSLLHDYYDEVVPLLRNVVYVVPAADGTSIVGDIYTRQLGVDNQNLYHDMFPSLVPGWMGDLISIALRIFPKKVLHGVLDAALDVLVGEILYRNTTMWSLVPAEYYETARDMWLKGDANAAVRAQTDHYYEAQKNSRANIQRMRADGVRVYDVCNYDVPLYSIAGSYTKYNADSVIQLSSTSLGAASGYVGVPLPEDYKAENPQCTNPDHRHMSPDGIVDASTGALPDQTWFFKGGWHDHTPSNDLAMRLIMRLVTSGKYETIYSMEAWPQFNNSRESRALRADLLPLAESVDPATLSAADAKELAAAIDEAKAVLAKTIGVPGEYEHAQDRVTAILVKLGLREAEKTDYLAVFLDPVFSFLNDALYKGFGARGFLDPFWVKQ
ncbi:MAG: hypothetical protein FWF05_06245 [Oscillospiraceae bacterium]|nr:hypothetical protein [Oscillospiraceae bacterium]